LVAVKAAQLMLALQIRTVVLVVRAAVVRGMEHHQLEVLEHLLKVLQVALVHNLQTHIQQVAVVGILL
jgi:hypothetical protein